MNPLIQLTKGTLLFLAVFVFACLGLLPKAQAVVPAPDGGYPGGNTAEGQNALLSRTTGTFNSALGFFSLSALTAGNFCTGVGAGALLLTTADANTAVGAAALLSNTTGAANTATGYQALFQTPPATTTRPMVLLRSLTLPAATTLHWAAAPASLRQRVQVTSILAQGCRALLAKATPVTSEASLAKRLPAESRFLLTRPINSVRLLPQSALRRISNRWTKPVKRCLHSNR